MIFDNKKSIMALLCLSNVTISFNTGAVAAAIPLIADGLFLPDFLVAKIVPFYMIPYGIGALLYAPLTRFFTYRTIFIVAMVIYSIMNLLSGLSQSLHYILLAQIGAGVAAASSTPLSLMVIGDSFNKEIRGRMVGIFFGSSFLASTVGMFFLGIVPWRWLFYIPAMMGIITVISLLLFENPALNKCHQESFNYFKAIAKTNVRNVFILIFAMSFLYHGIHKWYGLYLHNVYGLNEKAVSIILIVVALTGLLGQQVGGFLSDKKGRTFSFYVGIIGLSLGIILLYGYYPVAVLVFILGLIAIGWTIAHNSISTILTDFPDEDRPMIASLNSAIRFFSGGVGFSVSKMFVEKSFSYSFLGMGILMLSLILFIPHILQEKHKKGAL